MKRSRRSVALGIMMAAVLATGCAPEDASDPGAGLVSVPIEDQPGAVCGMLVRDQSAPRAQVVHRDGERSFLCSIGDMLVHLAAPSPHGKPAKVWVEAMEPEESPTESHPGPHEWILAEEAVYVVGIERPGIMGPPVLVYRNRGDAQRVAEGTTARILDFEELQQWWEQRSSAARLHRSDDLASRTRSDHPPVSG